MSKCVKENVHFTKKIWKHNLVWSPSEFGPYMCVHMPRSWGRMMRKKKVLRTLLVLENIYNCTKMKKQYSVANVLWTKKSVKKFMSIYFVSKHREEKWKRKKKGLSSFSSTTPQKSKSRVNSLYTWKKQLQVKIYF